MKLRHRSTFISLELVRVYPLHQLVNAERLSGRDFAIVDMIDFVTDDQFRTRKPMAVGSHADFIDNEEIIPSLLQTLTDF
jgi:hypothetical protein